jgi:hypothetical protein
MLTRKHIRALRSLSRKDIKPRNRRSLLIDGEILNGVCECALNTLKGNVRLNKKQKKILTKYKKDLRLLANKRTSKNRKKQIIIQKGGSFLPWLIAPAISLVSSLLQRDGS